MAHANSCLHFMTNAKSRSHSKNHAKSRLHFKAKTKRRSHSQNYTKSHLQFKTKKKSRSHCQDNSGIKKLCKSCIHFLKYLEGNWKITIILTVSDSFFGLLMVKNMWKVHLFTDLFSTVFEIIIQGLQKHIIHTYLNLNSTIIVVLFKGSY